MKTAFRRAYNVVRIMTGLSVFVAIFFLFFGATLAQAGSFVLITLVSSITGNVIAMTYSHWQYLRLARECNCPIEDIYFAIEDRGWQSGWIKDNAIRFHSDIAEERRKTK